MLARWTVQLIQGAALTRGERAQLLDPLGLSFEALAAPDATIGHDAACSIWERLAGDRPSDFGARFAEKFDVLALGLLGYVAAASASLGDMLTRVARYHGLVKRPPTASLTRSSTELSIVETPPPGARPWPRPLTEAILSAYLNVARRLTGVPLSAVRVRFQHAPPARPHDVGRVFGCAPEYRARVNELALPIDAWDLPLLTHDPTLLDYLETLAGQRTQQSEIDRARVHIAQSLSAERQPTLAATARALGLSSRTLQRRLLDEHGLAFRDLLDDVRRTSAQRLIDEGRLNLSEVSYLLGFRDPRALRKARRRWERDVA
jgi:AraC-like DNA-binding protein